jgi:hypothetical protein
MTPIPKSLRKAIEAGQLTEAQLRELIALEARALGLSPDEAIRQARARKLPRGHVADDLSLLVELLPA